MGSLAVSIAHAIPLQRVPGLALVLDTPKGRGVFATRDIPVKTVIDVCPVIVFGVDENESFVRHTQLLQYTYNWPYRNKETGQITTTQALVLGLGSMFNHSRINQNVVWERDVDNQVIRYTALCDIASGRELCPTAVRNAVVSIPIGVHPVLAILFCHLVHIYQAEDRAFLEREGRFYEMKDIPADFDKCSIEQKIVLLALKTQFTFRETAEIWRSRFHIRYNDKFLVRAYKILKSHSPPNQISFTRSELEELRIVAGRHEWLPDSHVIFILLIWQSGPTRVWQTIADAFNERFLSDFSISALIAYSLRYLHNKNSPDYFLRQPRGPAVALSNDEAWAMALEISTMDITEWSQAWLISFRDKFALREGTLSTPTSQTPLQTTETPQKGEAQALTVATETLRPLPTARTPPRDKAMIRQRPPLPMPTIKWQVPFSIPLQFILRRPNELRLTPNEPLDGYESPALTPIHQTKNRVPRVGLGIKNVSFPPAIANQAENSASSPGFSNKRKGRALQPISHRTEGDGPLSALAGKTENAVPQPAFLGTEDNDPLPALWSESENRVPQPVLPGIHQVEDNSITPASANRIKGNVPPVFLRADQAEGNSLIPSVANQTVVPSSYTPPQKALENPRARLRMRLGQFLSAFYDYTDLCWEEIAVACPLGPNWDWIRPNGGVFAHWEDCSKALRQLMVDTMAPHPPTDMLWATAFLDAHARGRSTFPKPQTRGNFMRTPYPLCCAICNPCAYIRGYVVLARIESQIQLAKRRVELKELRAGRD
ncbi:MAG: hypothetical protein M1839_008768 [Geoglossum umbratile]|nr:MAG: hypothetical protein M1839_008768 [Geoglossum umbratile]